MIFKKSQIFMFDTILAFMILILALALSFNYYISGTQNIDIYTLNKNILDGFTNTRVNSLNDEEIRDMFSKNLIRNVENTVAQQVVEFYENSHSDHAKNLTRLYVEDFVDKQMNFNITIKLDNGTASTDYVLYNLTNRPDISFESSDLTSVTQRRVFGFKNLTTFYGPYIVKIEIWK